MVTSDQLPDDLTRALADIARVPGLLVASDFDGTISPIVSNPGDARPIPAAAKALSELAALPDTAAVLVSGRALDDLRELSGAPTGVELVGSHGSEFSAGFAAPVSESARALLGDVVDTMRTLAAKYPGATVETKPISVAFHVRNVADADAQTALDEALAAVHNLDVFITEGKAVREFAVIETSKGAALDLLRAQSDTSATVYFGDDVTDEKAFAHLRGEGDVSVKVGPGESQARYRVDTPHQVALALELLRDLRSQPS